MSDITIQPGSRLAVLADAITRANGMVTAAQTMRQQCDNELATLAQTPATSYAQHAERQQRIGWLRVELARLEQEERRMIQARIDAQRVYQQVYEQCRQAVNVLRNPIEPDPRVPQDARYLLKHFTAAP